MEEAPAESGSHAPHAVVASVHGSLTILAGLLRECDRTRSRKVGNDVLMLFSVVLTTLWRDFWSETNGLLTYQTVRILNRTLYILPL